MKKTIIDNQHERVGRFVADRIGLDSSFANFVGIGLEEDGELIAGVVFNDCNGTSVCMHVGAVPGRRWLTREFLWFCFYYPFEQLKVKRITGIVEEGNLDARRFDEHLGFELETQLKAAGNTGDLLIYRMFKENCRFLGIKQCIT